MEPFHYINQVPGKDVRGKLIDAFQVGNIEYSQKRRARADTLLYRKSVLDHGRLQEECKYSRDLHKTSRSRSEGITSTTEYSSIIPSSLDV